MHWTLRLLTAVIVAVMAGAIALATAWAVARTTEGVAQPRSEERLRATQSGALAVNGWFERAVADARSAARTVPTSGLEPEVSRALDGVVEGSALNHAYLVDQDGVVVAATTSATGLVGLDREGDLVDRALAGSVAVSGVVTDPLLRQPAVEVAVPVGDPGAGAVVGISELAGGGLRAVLDALPLAPTAELAAVASDGTVVRPDQQPTTIQRVGPNLAPPSRDAPTSPGLLEYEGEAGIAKVASHAPIGHGWQLVVYEDAASFSPTAEGARAVLAAAPGLLALVGIIVGGFLLLDGRARRRGAEAEETKRSFLAVTGHELRTPLTVLSGLVETLDRRGARVPAEYREKAISSMAVQTRRLELLIERLLFVSHLESGAKIDVRISRADIAPLLKRTVDEQQAAWPLHSFHADVEAPLEAMADASALRHVLRHLLENAARYSPSGGQIRLTGRRAGRTVEITVEDEGIGLPADTSQIFDKFVQGETVDTRLRDEGGIGMGLFIVRTLTEAMHGSVSAARRDPGAAFKLRLRGAD